MGIPQLEIVVFTHPGLVRTQNEDAIAAGPFVASGISMQTPSRVCLESPAVVAVADGLGGHAGGTQASNYAASRLVATPDRLASEGAATNFLQDISDDLVEISTRDPSLRGLGTTVAGVRVDETGSVFFSVGDSRVYRLDGPYLGELTVSDRLGDTGPVTQCLGGTPTPTRIAAHVGTTPLVAGEQFLICSDGVSDVITLETLERLLDTGGVQGVQRIADAVLEAGAPDNFSIALVSPVDRNYR